MVLMSLFAEQQWRHSHREETFGPWGRGLSLSLAKPHDHGWGLLWYLGAWGKREERDVSSINGTK